FEMWWPELEKNLKEVRTELAGAPSPGPTEPDILREILLTVRDLAQMYGAVPKFTPAQWEALVHTARAPGAHFEHASGTATAGETMTCFATAQPLLVRAEGITERIGDITLTFSGGSLAPAEAVPKFDIEVVLNVNLTNHVSDRRVSDALLVLE